MALARKLFLNLDTRRRQLSDLSVSPDPVQTLTFYKYEQLPLEVAIVEFDRDNPSRVHRLDISGWGLKVIINDTLDDATPLVELSGVNVTTDESENVFRGTLNLNTAGMTSYVGSADKTPYFIILIYDGTNWVPVVQETCNVLVTAATQTTVAPDPSQRYLTYEEAVGIFVQRVMGAGETITWRDASGTNLRIIGVRTDGTPQDDAI